MTAKRAHALPSTKPRQGMPWLRGEATGLPGLRTANLQRDHRSRLESSSFRAMEDVNHGSLMTADLMNDYPALLAAGRRVITVERQGHGHTRDIGRPLWYELLAGDIAALLDHLGLPRAGTSHAGLYGSAEWVGPMIAEFLGDAGG